MIWINQIVFWIPLIFSVSVLLYLFRQIILKGKLKRNVLFNLTLALVGLSILQLLARILIFYWQLKKSSLGSYLLPGKGSTFFLDHVWASYIQPFIFLAIIALVLVIIIFLVRKKSQRPLFEDSDWLIVLLTAFSAGFPNLLVMLIGALLLMIIFQLFQRVVFKRSLTERLKIAPFLIFASLVVIVLANFTFYIKFLSLIGLTNF